jgi:hypothetical protein
LEAARAWNVSGMTAPAMHTAPPVRKVDPMPKESTSTPPIALDYFHALGAEFFRTFIHLMDQSSHWHL